MDRRFMLGLLATGASLGLSACGFELRKAPNFPFNTLYSPLPETSTLGVELKRSLESGGRVKVLSDAREINQADVILEVLADERKKTVVGLNASGQVREFQLALTFRFRLRTPLGKELIPVSEILQRRDIGFNESAVLSKEAEEALLYRDMQRDIVQQIMRRLAAVSSL